MRLRTVEMSKRKDRQLSWAKTPGTVQSELERSQVSGKTADKVLILRNLTFDKWPKQRLRMKVQNQTTSNHYPSTDQEVQEQLYKCR